MLACLPGQVKISSGHVEIKLYFCGMAISNSMIFLLLNDKVIVCMKLNWFIFTHAYENWKLKCCYEASFNFRGTYRKKQITFFLGKFNFVCRVSE